MKNRKLLLTTLILTLPFISVFFSQGAAASGGAAAGDHVVDLSLGVGPLGVGLARPQHVHPHREIRDREELEVRPAARSAAVGRAPVASRW